ncbi:hypothetical protein ACFXG4_17715 [Nocardia sp. NPDC059246]|uniref:hypothetical protein n=1 Tax=unclassified Nocardia TaxID=2637762 RepID=UPI0036B9E7F9
MTRPVPPAKPPVDMVRRRKINTVVVSATGAILSVIALIVIVGAVGGDKKSAPDYPLSHERDVSGAVVTFDAEDDLHAVFGDIVEKNEDLPDGGYFVEINCATGGSAAADNRLANRR